MSLRCLFLGHDPLLDRRALVVTCQRCGWTSPGLDATVPTPAPVPRFAGDAQRHRLLNREERQPRRLPRLLGGRLL